MATQLRCYALHPHLTEQFLSWFPTLLPERAKFGFSVLSAHINRETNEFTWIVTRPGDNQSFQEAEAAWFASPERAALFAGQPAFAAEMHISMVETIDLPS
jgi:hypothetical protein